MPPVGQDVVAEIEMVLVSHLHSDHFDPTAQELLPKDIQILCQAGDEAQIVAKGFQRVTPIADVLTWHGIRITRTPCQHGSDEVLDEMGRASGFILEAEQEPKVFRACTYVRLGTLNLI